MSTTHIPKGGMCTTCTNGSKACADLQFASMQPIQRYPDGITAVKCSSHCAPAALPPHKSLFNAPPDTGLPIGNLSSQFFANILLDGLDQHVKHQMRAPHYVRYVDDFVLLHPSAGWLVNALRNIEEWLPQNLGLHLNPRKTIIQPAARGIDFVGQVIKPWRRTTRPRTLHSALKRLKHMPAAEVYAAGNSYLGLARQASHSHKEQAQICRALLKRGHAIESLHLSKAFRNHQS